MKPYKEIEMKLNRDRFEIFAKEQDIKMALSCLKLLAIPQMNTNTMPTAST